MYLVSNSVVAPQTFHNCEIRILFVGCHVSIHVLEKTPNIMRRRVGVPIMRFLVFCKGDCTVSISSAEPTAIVTLNTILFVLFGTFFSVQYFVK